MKRITMPSSSIKRQRSNLKRLKKPRCFNLCRLTFAALPTIVFGVFTVVFTLQQDASDRATLEQKQAHEDETNRRIIFKGYIDDMTDLLFNHADNQTIEKTLLHIRAQTITVLQNLDADRQRSVILFLYENRLLRSDILPNVDLRGANLNNLRFWSSSSVAYELSNLYLPGVHAENITFDHCSLIGAVFDNSWMSSAKFLGCSMLNIRFVNTNLTRAHFHGNYVYNANFSSSQLIQSSINGGTFRKVDLTNADLYQSDINDELLYPSKFNSLGLHTFLNTRHSNGSFSNINGKNLAYNDGLVSECPSKYHLSSRNLSQTMFKIDQTISQSECFFGTDRDITVLKIIDVRQFSLLIDLERAVFNLSTFIRFNISNTDDEFTLTIQFVQNDEVIDEDASLTVLRKNNLRIHFESFNGTIPRLTRSLMVILTCDTTRDIRQFCAFDNVELFIFEREFYLNRHQNTIKRWH